MDTNRKVKCGFNGLFRKISKNPEKLLKIFIRYIRITKILNVFISNVYVILGG